MAPYAPRTPSHQQSREQPSPGLITLARGKQPEADLEIKKSHFLARACRTDSMDEAWSFIVDVRPTYPDVRHYCLALIPANLPDGHTLVITASPTERSSDDDEPSGTAGQPMLGILRGTGLINTTIVVTRYFGKTLLGVGGLVRAYSEATAQVPQAAAQVTLTRLHLWDLRIPVTQAGRIEAELRSRNPAMVSDPAAEGGTVISAPTIRVEKMIWGPTHAAPVLTTSYAGPNLLYASLAALTRGEGAVEPAGSRLMEVPVPPA